jgi:predicted Zn-dependent peptidase
VPFFESLGLTFGRDQNAFPSFDRTTYQIMVPAGRPDALDKAVLFMADVATGLDLSPEEIERERGVIVEARRHYERAGASAVHDAFRRHWRNESRFTIEVVPETRSSPVGAQLRAPADTSTVAVPSRYGIGR